MLLLCFVLCRESRKTPVHPTNKSLAPVQILDIFPDFLASNGSMQYSLSLNHASTEEGEEEGGALSEKQKKQQSFDAMFNVQYTWAEFDYAPVEEKEDSSAMLTDEAAAAAGVAPPAASVVAAAAAKPVPLLKSYNAQHHGFYLSDPANPYGPTSVEPPAGDASDDEDGSRGRAAALAKSAAAAAAAARADPNIESSEYYRWLREYVKVPTPRVEQQNNYFFILKATAGGAQPNAIYYSQYADRIKIAKRTKVSTAGWLWRQLLAWSAFCCCWSECRWLFVDVVSCVLCVV